VRFQAFVTGFCKGRSIDERVGASFFDDVFFLFEEKLPKKSVKSNHCSKSSLITLKCKTHKQKPSSRAVRVCVTGLWFSAPDDKEKGLPFESVDIQAGGGSRGVIGGLLKL